MRDQPVELRLSGRELGDRRVERGLRAGDRGRAARVEPDQVEAVAQLFRELVTGVLHGFRAATARAARVEQQFARALARLGGGQSSRRAATRQLLPQQGFFGSLADLVELTEHCRQPEALPNNGFPLRDRPLITH
ncbi:MAG TPA: hypothetical protein VGN81_16870 [Pseudonocardiaceae bacterium]